MLQGNQHGFVLTAPPPPAACQTPVLHGKPPPTLYWCPHLSDAQVAPLVILPRVQEDGFGPHRQHGRAMGAGRQHRLRRAGAHLHGGAAHLALQPHSTHSSTQSEHACRGYTTIPGRLEA
jgi:hypothetical protein